MSYRIAFALLGLLVATAAEVAGISYWLYQVEQGRPWLAFLALVAGEAVEWSLLTALILSNARKIPESTGQVPSLVAKMASIIFSESLLWVCWLELIPRVGFVAALAALLVFMHLKHAAGIAVYAGRSFSQELMNPWDVMATVLEVGGAAVFYQLFFADQVALGIAILGVCITIEHSLQIVAASTSSTSISNAKEKHVSFS